jgi:magnesium-protoporphyrin O-methyltransferase
MTDTQCSCGGANLFGRRQATGQLKRYRQKGPDKTTRLLLDALTAEGVAGLSLLDIGGGIGIIAQELFKTGITTAIEVEASPAYVTHAQAEAARHGVSDRLSVRAGDFVALAADLPPAGIVTLDRVICCYPDMPALVAQSAAKAAKLYGVVYPRDTWWVRVIGILANLVLPRLRTPLRLYIHPSTAVEAIIQGSGLAPRFHRDVGYWQVSVYARPA